MNPSVFLFKEGTFFPAKYPPIPHAKADIPPIIRESLFLYFTAFVLLKLKLSKKIPRVVAAKFCAEFVNLLIVNCLVKLANRCMQLVLV